MRFKKRIKKKKHINPVRVNCSQNIRDFNGRYNIATTAKLIVCEKLEKRKIKGMGLREKRSKRTNHS